MYKPSVYVTRPLPLEALALLKERCDVEMNDDASLSGAALTARLKGRDAVLAVATPVDELVCRALKERCKIIANYGVGYNHIDVAAATRGGIWVTNTPNAVTAATADLTWALLLAAARRIVECDRFVRSGRQGWGVTNMMGTQVAGKTIGIVGGGRIGCAVGRRASGFDMRILYTGTRRRPDFEDAAGGTFVDKETLLKEADFVSLHAPLLEATYHYIGAAELKLMKRTAILINAARGPVVDEKALVRALWSGEIGGAGLDVFEREPELEKGLGELPNVVLTPHIGTSTLDARVEMGNSCARSIFAALDDMTPPYCLNPEARREKAAARAGGPR